MTVGSDDPGLGRGACESILQAGIRNLKYAESSQWGLTIKFSIACRRDEKVTRDAVVITETHQRRLLHVDPYSA